MAATLEQAAREHGLPKRIRVDNGPEFISRDLDLRAYANGVELDFSRPGIPANNSYIEGFISRFRQECLNACWFLSLEDARSKIEAWRTDYDATRTEATQLIRLQAAGSRNMDRRKARSRLRYTWATARSGLPIATNSNLK